MAATLALLLVGAGCLVQLLSTPVTLTSLGWLVLAVFGLAAGLASGVLTYGFFGLRYRLDRGALVICWLGSEEAVPYREIDAIYAGSRLGRSYGPKGLNLAGYRIGSGWAKGAGAVKFYTTSRRDGDVSVIASRQGVYALTPADPALFRRELIARIEARERPGIARARVPVWARLARLRDSAALFSAGVSLLVLLLITARLMDQYASLPALLALHFDPAGRPDVVAPKDALFLLPGIGALVLLANLGVGAVLAASERVLARLVWLATPVLQAVVLVSALRLLP